MNTALRDELLQHLDAGSTGCLSVVSQGGQLKLFVMSGEILAARSADDDVQLLRRVVAASLVSRDTAADLLRRASEEDQTVGELLYEVLDEGVVAGLLFDRFHENISLWLSASSAAEFEPLDAIFLTDIHTHHDSRELLGRIEVVLARTEPLRDSVGFQTVLRPGPARASSREDHALLAVIGGGLTVARLVRSSPFEELTTLNHVALMLEADILERGVRSDAQPLVSLSPDAPSSEVAPDGDAPRGEDDSVLPALDAGTLDAEDSEAFVEELDLFEDYDSKVGRGGPEGQFTHMGGDVVDLTGGLGQEEHSPGVREEVPGAGGAVQVKYSGPMLSTSDALRKIEVANEVLRALSQAFDDENGVGSGPSQVQLLLDGSPAEYSDIFRSVEAGRDGAAAPDALIANLRRRMPSEHRHVLNRALADLIDRAMNVAADSLEDDEAIDTVMEMYAGYPGRLGL